MLDVSFAQHVMCLPQGRLLASGQYGENADVCVWDYQNKKLLYRFSEHDFGIAALSFSDDERLLVSVGDVRDKKMFVWDLATGCINASTPMQPNPTNIVGFGGMVKSTSGATCLCPSCNPCVCVCARAFGLLMSASWLTIGTSSSRQMSSVAPLPTTSSAPAATANCSFGLLTLSLASLHPSRWRQAVM